MGHARSRFLACLPAKALVPPQKIPPKSLFRNTLLITHSIHGASRRNLVHLDENADFQGVGGGGYSPARHSRNGKNEQQIPRSSAATDDLVMTRLGELRMAKRERRRADPSTLTRSTSPRELLLMQRLRQANKILRHDANQSGARTVDLGDEKEGHRHKKG